MFSQFQVRYPTGSLISDLITIYNGKYVVRVLVEVDGIARATGMAVADTIEQAEDQARIRALAVMGIHITGKTNTQPEVSEFAQRLPFSTERSEPSNLTSISTDTSWLNESKNVSLPEKTSSIASSKVNNSFSGGSQTVTGNLDWQKNDYIQTPEIDSSVTEVEPTIAYSKVTPIGSRRHEPEIDTVETNQPIPKTNSASEKTGLDAPTDSSDTINMINIEMKRVGWTNEQGREYLWRTYKKRSRAQLSDEQLVEFLSHLESLPSPES
ncbi:MAG TPA: hypothetical protein V6D28_24605 [Leptolyngbyaceae cyanobacterium]